ncbi:hypothetical protein BgiBS90_015025, partial [Biomphalaria glabrata]
TRSEREKSSGQLWSVVVNSDMILSDRIASNDSQTSVVSGITRHHGTFRWTRKTDRCPA